MLCGEKMWILTDCRGHMQHLYLCDKCSKCNQTALRRRCGHNANIFMLFVGFIWLYTGSSGYSGLFISWEIYSVSLAAWEFVVGNFAL